VPNDPAQREKVMQPASLVLFAQKGGGGGDAGAALGGLMCLLIPFLILAIAFAIHIFYLLACSRCWAEISPRNRGMEPGMVWLCLIPLFGFVWHVVMMFKFVESLRAEYRYRGMRGDGDFGQLATILYLIGLVVPFLSLIGFIVHWVKISGYTQELRRTHGRSRGDYDDDDYDDDDDDYDRPRRRRRDRDDRDDDDRRSWDRD
jgi:hypothetical protein